MKYRIFVIEHTDKNYVLLGDSNQSLTDMEAEYFHGLDEKARTKYELANFITWLQGCKHLKLAGNTDWLTIPSAGCD